MGLEECPAIVGETTKGGDSRPGEGPARFPRERIARAQGAGRDQSVGDREGWVAQEKTDVLHRRHAVDNTGRHITSDTQLALLLPGISRLVALESDIGREARQVAD